MGVGSHDRVDVFIFRYLPPPHAFDGMVCEETKITCPTVPTEAPSGGSEWMEQEVVWVFRLWHMIFLCVGGLLTFIMLVCCFIRVRFPRTKQDIEADFKRKKLTRKFRKHLDKLQIEDTDLKSALDRVQERVAAEGIELQNGEITKVDSAATTPASTRSLPNSIGGNTTNANSVPPVKTVQPQISNSSTEEDITRGSEVSSLPTAKLKMKNSVTKSKNKQAQEA